MKIEIKKDEEGICGQKGEIFGIELIPKNKTEVEILERFWKGGVKINVYTSSGHLQLTFADLIEGLKVKEHTKGTLICKKCKEPLAICNMLDDSNNLIGYSHSCRTCGYSFSEKA